MVVIIKYEKCPFCDAVNLQKFIEERTGNAAGIKTALSVALVSYAVVDRRKSGRSTDYMKNGEGFPLNFCPSCGKRLCENE